MHKENFNRKLTTTTTTTTKNKNNGMQQERFESSEQIANFCVYGNATRFYMYNVYFLVNLLSQGVRFKLVFCCCCCCIAQLQSS